MTTQEWLTLLSPLVAAVVGSLILILAAVVSGLTAKASAYLTAHHQAATAAAVVSAGQVMNQLLTVGASTISGKIQTGQLDWLDRAAWQKEATAEVAVAMSRMPEALAFVPPAATTLIADLMAKVDAQVVASPTIPSPATASASASPADAILGAVATIAASKSALDTLTPPVAAAASVPMPAPASVTPPPPPPALAPIPMTVLVDPAGVPVSPAPVTP